ncbi:MAG: DNA polymerase III subunit epsilon [Alphaproteobacteria bacterium]|nr:DNA polymerase III subunit epsilon [Alphaproteobacteria bacterium]
MREIVLDTETTGLDPGSGHRLVEIGCLELVNHVPTGRIFQSYVNPERDMPEEAFKIHGLSAEFLARQPLFAAVVEDFLTFIGEAPLVIHNAVFDLGFLNAELARLGRPALLEERAIDTVALARAKFPGTPANLDALCRRFAIDASGRERHGALLDAGLLADVYLALIGGRQPGLGLAARPGDALAVANSDTRGAAGPARTPRRHAASDEEVAAHAAFVDTLKEPLWRR